jgi:hypothetical protein
MKGPFILADLILKFLKRIDEKVSIGQNLSKLLVSGLNRFRCQFGPRFNFHFVLTQPGPVL